MKRINLYSFGNIIVDGAHYTNDIIIFPEYIQDSWWRKLGHSLCMEDLKTVIEFLPDILIIGTGAYGAMKVTPSIKTELSKLRIEVIIENSYAAVETYNSCIDIENKVAGAFHLTC